MIPLNKNILIEPIPKSSSAIELTDKQVPTIGTVKATDSELVNIGDKVLYKRWNKQDVPESKLVLIEEKDILLRYEE
jgi:co-chaperonin GroES (HSP10)